MSGDAPVLTAALTALRDDFNRRFPRRDKATDGWIGDAAHQLTTSGHNPDDTAGVRAEYSDADTKPEVRAIDVDKDLNDAEYTMQDVIDQILISPDDLRRLRYIIYSRVIWSKSNGWRPAEYTGLNPHTEHAHFSGDPLFDEDNSPWSVATMGDTMTDSQAYIQHVMNYRIDAITHARLTVTVPAFTAPSGKVFTGFTEECQFGQIVRQILDKVNGITVGDAPTAEEIADAVIAEIAS